MDGIVRKATIMNKSKQHIIQQIRDNKAKGLQKRKSVMVFSQLSEDEESQLGKIKSSCSSPQRIASRIASNVGFEDLQPSAAKYITFDPPNIVIEDSLMERPRTASKAIRTSGLPFQSQKTVAPDLWKRTSQQGIELSANSSTYRPMFGSPGSTIQPGNLEFGKSQGLGYHKMATVKPGSKPNSPYFSPNTIQLTSNQQTPPMKQSGMLKQILSQSQRGMMQQQQGAVPRASYLSSQDGDRASRSLFSNLKNLIVEKFFGGSKPVEEENEASVSEKSSDHEGASKKAEKKERSIKSVISKLVEKKEAENEETPQPEPKIQQYQQIDIMKEYRDESMQIHQGSLSSNGEQAQRQFSIRADHPLKLFWNFLVILTVLAVCITLPLRLGFIQEFVFAYYDAICHSVFAIDIILTSFTTVFNQETGEVIKNHREILRHYTSSSAFLLDLIPAIPLSSIITYELRYVSLNALQLIKLFRLQPAIFLHSQSETTKLMMKLVTLLFYMLIYIHFSACYVYYVVDQERIWIPKQARFNDGFEDFYEADLGTKYLTCLNTAILLFMGNDTGPESDWQLGVAFGMIMVGALINANIFGTITVVVSSLNRKTQKLQDKMDMANTSMTNMKLPIGIQQDIRDFMMSTQNNLDTQKELDTFMQMISPSLRNKVTKHIFLGAVASNPVLQGSEDIVDYLINEVNTLLYLPEDHIISQGEQGDSLYLIAKGDCSVWVSDHMRASRFVRQLNQGEYFGEVSILYETPRTATVKSSNYCTLANLSRKTFFDLCNNFPQIIVRMRERTLDYKDPWKVFKKRVLEEVEYLAKISKDCPSLLDEIQYHLQDEYLEEGTEIIGPDCPLQQLLFVVQGQVDLVVFDQNGDEKLLDTLEQGDMIGQYSVLFDETPIFSAIAKTRVRVLILSQDFFIENKDHIEGLDQAIIECEEDVQEYGIPLCDYQKFFRPGTLREKMLRAKRKAQILENSLVLSQLQAMDQLGELAVPRRGSKTGSSIRTPLGSRGKMRSKGRTRIASKKKKKKTSSQDIFSIKKVGLYRNDSASPRQSKKNPMKRQSSLFSLAKQGASIGAAAGKIAGKKKRFTMGQQQLAQQLNELHKLTQEKPKKTSGNLLLVPELPSSQSSSLSSSSSSSSSSEGLKTSQNLGTSSPTVSPSSHLPVMALSSPGSKLDLSPDAAASYRKKKQVSTSNFGRIQLQIEDLSEDSRDHIPTEPELEHAMGLYIRQEENPTGPSRTDKTAEESKTEKKNSSKYSKASSSKTSSKLQVIPIVESRQESQKTTPQRKRLDTLEPQRIELPGLKNLKEEAKSSHAKTPTSSPSRRSPVSLAKPPTMLQQSQFARFPQRKRIGEEDILFQVKKRITSKLTSEEASNGRLTSIKSMNGSQVLQTKFQGLKGFAGRSMPAAGIRKARLMSRRMSSRQKVGGGFGSFLAPT